jgi:hypothetical protein
MLTRKTEGKGLLHEIASCRREDHIRMELTEVRWEGVDWMHLDLDK